jgi:multidrug efflux system membrane fusion protein
MRQSHEHHPRHFALRSVPVIALSFSLSACSVGGTAQNPGSPGAGRGGGRGDGGGASVPVVTTQVVAKPVPVTIPAVGTVEAISSIQMRAQVTGQVSAVHFAEGQEVLKGQPLFTIDPRPFEAALAQVEAALARDTATAKNQQSEQARYADLFKQGLIPRDQYETQAAGVQASQATLQLDQAAVQTARLNLQYTNITAPMAGRTGSLGVHVGDLARANDTNPMVVINELSPIYVTFSVPGRYLEEIQRYQALKPLTVETRSQASVAPGAQQPAPTSAAPDNEPAVPSGAVEQGRVTFIDNAVDATTGTIKLKGTFANADRALWPGLFVQVTLNLATNAKALVVPASAVQSSQDGQYVYVVKPDRTAEMRRITVKRQQGEDAVIATGLAAGEEVVTDGQLRLTPGARVSTTARGKTSS